MTLATYKLNCGFKKSHHHIGYTCIPQPKSPYSLTLSWPPQHWIDRGKGQSWQYLMEDRFLTPGRLICVTRGKLMIMAAGKIRYQYMQCINDLIWMINSMLWLSVSASNPTSSEWNQSFFGQSSQMTFVVPAKAEHVWTFCVMWPSMCVVVDVVHDVWCQHSAFCDAWGALWVSGKLWLRSSFLVSTQNPRTCNVRGSCTKVGHLRGQCKLSKSLHFKM